MITIKARAKGDKTGPIFATINGNADGTYEFPNVTESSYCFEISADGYITEWFDFDLEDAFVMKKDFVLSPALKGEWLRVILTWGAEPKDLDTHAVGKYKSVDLDIYYNNKEKLNDDGNKVANLDIDNTSGFGPETLTIFDKGFEFVYKVNNYSKHPDMSKTSVQVKVYHKDGRQWTFNIQSKDNPMYWCPFKFVNGDVIELNEYLDGSGNKLGGGAPTSITSNTSDPSDPSVPDDPGSGGSSSSVDDISYIDTYVNIPSGSTYPNYSTELPNGYKASSYGYNEISSNSAYKEMYTRVFNALRNNGHTAQYIVNTFGSTATSMPIDSVYTLPDGNKFLLLYADDLNINVRECHKIISKVISDFPGLMAKFNLYTWFYHSSEDDSLSGNDRKCYGFGINYFDEATRRRFITKSQETFNKIAAKVTETYPSITFDQNAYKTDLYTETQKKQIGKVIHDFLVLNGEYGDTSETNWLNQTMYPALSEYTCTSDGCAGPVCASYACAFKYCCWRFGIAALHVGGSCGNERDGRHAWNIVSYKSNLSFNDTNSSSWQEVDCTWDDPTFSDGHHYDYVSFEHLNITTAEITTGVHGTGRTRWILGLSSNPAGDEFDGYYERFPDNNNSTCSSNKYAYTDNYNGGVAYGGF